jgi:hypothetical protein
MIQLKQVNTKYFTLTLYEFYDGTYSAVKTINDKEIPSVPTNDLNSALATFDLFYEQLTLGVQ